MTALAHSAGFWVEVLGFLVAVLGLGGLLAWDLRRRRREDRG